MKEYEIDEVGEVHDEWRLVSKKEHTNKRLEVIDRQERVFTCGVIVDNTAINLEFKVIELNETLNLGKYQFRGKTLCAFKGKELIAVMDLSDYNANAENIEVYTLEVVYKGKGYGSLVIEQLKNYYHNIKQLQGMATPSSKPFWSKVGVEFYKSDDIDKTSGELHFKLDYK